MGLFDFFRNLSNDDRFSRARIIIENLKKLTVDEYGSMALKVFEFAAEMKLAGDYLEFGCFGGYTMTWAYRAAKKFGMDQLRFYAFDSFQGLPDIKGVDADFHEFRKGEFSTSEQRFYRDLKRGGVDISRVRTIPGWYDETLSNDLYQRLPVKEAAVILIDCDIYASTVPVLEFIVPYLVDGTVLIFDDWNCFKASPEYGERKACQEWLARHKNIKLQEYLPFEAFGQTFIVHC